MKLQEGRLLYFGCEREREREKEKEGRDETVQVCRNEIHRATILNSESRLLSRQSRITLNGIPGTFAIMEAVQRFAGPVYQRTRP